MKDKLLVGAYFCMEALQKSVRIIKNSIECIMNNTNFKINEILSIL